MQLIPINPKTGKRATFGEPGVILEAFKPGEEPPEESDGGVIGANLGGAAGSDTGAPANDNAGGDVQVYGGVDSGGGGAAAAGGASRGAADGGRRRAAPAEEDSDLTTGTGGLY